MRQHHVAGNTALIRYGLALLLLLAAGPVWGQQSGLMAPDTGLGERVPRPDPSVLTTAQINAAITSLRDQTVAADAAIKQLIDERFTSAERATDLRLQAVNAIPAMVTSEVDHALALIYAKLDQQNEKFASISTRLDDNRRFTDQLGELNSKNVDRTSQLIDTAINKAFASAEQARATSEQTTKAQIESQGEIQRTNNENSDRLIRDLNDRLTRMESRQIGQGEAKTERNDNTNILLGIGGLAVAVVVAGLAMSRVREQPQQVRYVQQALPAAGITTTTNTTPS
jgi:hypothetical protein